MSNFTHIHVHSDKSRLDGLSRVEELFRTAQSLGQTALAITDHGTTSGLWEAQQIADELGMKAIHGNEFYYERENDGKNGHLLILAKNDAGLRNIFQLQKYSFQHNFQRNPRINWDKLVEHKEGLIVTSACLGSPFNQYIMAGDISGATQWARKFKEEFQEDFYIEIQPNSIPEQVLCNQASVRIAKQLNIQLVATNDVHYTFESDCFPHEVLLAIQVRKKMSDENRFKFPADDFWLKSEEEMYEGFEYLDPQVVKQAIQNTKVIESKCDASIKPGRYLPEFYDTPDGFTEGETLKQMTYDGVADRGLADNKEFTDGIEHELSVIDEEGYSGYFLIVKDYVESAKARGEVAGDGRGSGAGSKVAYATGITEVPPHEYDLLFERFMAKGRSPDFDVDFSNQEAVFQDLRNKYGNDNVARIVNFGTLTPKACIRRVMSAFDHPAWLVKQINALIPDLCRKLSEAYEINPQLLEFKKKYHVEWGVIERLQNIVSHQSTHAGGVIIYPDIASHLPVITTADNRDHLVVGWDMKMIERLGHYKFDVLALETLPVIQRTLESIYETTGKEIVLQKIPLDDPGVYGMLRAGDVSGVFQINAQAQKTMEQKPENFLDLVALSALIRP